MNVTVPVLKVYRMMGEADILINSIYSMIEELIGFQGLRTV